MLKAKGSVKALPCYEYFEGRCTAGSSCVYSHERASLEKYGEDLLKKIANAIKSGNMNLDKVFTTLKNPQTIPLRPAYRPGPQDIRQTPAGRGAFHGGKPFAKVQLLTRNAIQSSASEDSDSADA